MKKKDPLLLQHLGQLPQENQQPKGKQLVEKRHVNIGREKLQREKLPERRSGRQPSERRLKRQQGKLQKGRGKV